MNYFCYYVEALLIAETCRTDAELRAYLTEFFLINVTSDDLDNLLALYPQDPTQGSPFDTGTQNVLTPEFKRIAALLGDFVFQAPRRWLLDNVSGKQNTWSYCALALFPCSCALVPPTDTSILAQ
jgi:acetylcholinesterase